MTVKETIELAKKSQKTLNAFVTIVEDAKEGIPIAVKDNFSTKGILSTGSSNTLKNYIPFWDATIITKLKEKGYSIIGKTVMDELGMGATGTTGHTGIVKNPWNKNHIAGGSSAGSAAAVAAGIVPFAIGSDTGDSIRKPAAYCGIVGYKPTYGMVSRNGLFPFACSLDHVGAFARNVKDVAKVIDDIKGIDSHDMTTWDSSSIKLEENLNDNIKGKKLFYIKEICNISNYSNQTEELKETLNTFNETISKIKNLGVEIEEISFEKNILNAILGAYLCISCAESTSNYSNLTGISFGPRGTGKTVTDQIKDHRTKGFSTLIKRRFIIGSYVLQKDNQEKYFLNAQRVRRVIVDKMNELFELFDGLILPCSAGGAPLIEGTNDIITKEGQVLENHMAIANFGGYPSITIPNGFINNMPIGINITGKIKDDANILNIAHNIENVLGYKDQIAKGEWL